MAKVAAKHGISLTAGNISFTSETATIKVAAGVIGASGVVVTKEAKAFEYVVSYGFFTTIDIGVY